MESIFAMMQSFTKEKMKKRMHVHPKGADFATLHEVIGKEVLPVEYGGTNGKLQDHIGNFSFS